MAACAHDGFHSAIARYDRERGQLLFLRTCDGCGVVVSELGTQRYRPRYDPLAGAGALLDRDRLREVARLVHVQSPVAGDSVCE